MRSIVSALLFLSNKHRYPETLTLFPGREMQHLPWMDLDDPCSLSRLLSSLVLSASFSSQEQAEGKDTQRWKNMTAKITPSLSPSEVEKMMFWKLYKYSSYGEVIDSYSISFCILEI